jgi:WD40 repeat protein
MEQGNLARLWDLDGKEIQVFTGHEKTVECVAFSPDSKYVLTGSRDGTARLWDLAGRELTRYHLFDGKDAKEKHNGIQYVAFSPDGLTITTFDNKNVKRFWRNVIGEWESGVLWDRVQRLRGEERMKFGIDWAY